MGQPIRASRICNLAGAGRSKECCWSPPRHSRMPPRAGPGVTSVATPESIPIRCRSAPRCDAIIQRLPCQLWSNGSWPDESLSPATRIARPSAPRFARPGSASGLQCPVLANREAERPGGAALSQAEPLTRAAHHARGRLPGRARGKPRMLLRRSQPGQTYVLHL